METRTALIAAGPGTLALDRNKTAVYLAGLESESSRRTMRGALAQIAELMRRADPFAKASKREQQEQV